MVVGICIFVAWLFAACALLILGARWTETMWFRKHPPDDWEAGCRVEKFDEEDDDT